MKLWFERATEEIEQEHEDGNMSDKECSQAMKDLQQEYDDYAREDAQNCYDGWYQ